MRKLNYTKKLINYKSTKHFKTTELYKKTSTWRFIVLFSFQNVRLEYVLD